MPIKIHAFCASRTWTDGVKWRDEDYSANFFKKTVKGERVTREYKFPVSGIKIGIGPGNSDVVLGEFARWAVGRLRRIHDRPITLVPIPNSSAVVGNSTPFRTAILAERVAQASNGDVQMLPCLRWAKAMDPSHKGGSRDPYALKAQMRLTGDPKGQIVLFDDVVTTGSHFIAGYNLLRENGYSVRGAIAAVRSLLPEDEQPVVFNIEPFEIRLPEDWFGGISLQDFLSSGN